MSQRQRRTLSAEEERTIQQAVRRAMPLGRLRRFFLDYHLGSRRRRMASSVQAAFQTRRAASEAAAPRLDTATSSGESGAAAAAVTDNGVSDGGATNPDSRHYAIYAVENFDPAPNEELVCTICFCVFNDPVESPCRHVFCRGCITHWLQERGSCPICRKLMSSRTIAECLPILKSMINKLTLFCENKGIGCEDKVTLENYNKHRDECEYAEIKCSNPSCKFRCQRREMKQHQGSCKKRLSMCKALCKRYIRLDKIDKHDCGKELKKFNAELLEKVETLESKVAALEKQLREQKSESLRQQQQQQHTSSSNGSSGLNLILGMVNNALGSGGSGGNGDDNMESFSTDSDDFSYHGDEAMSDFIDDSTDDSWNNDY